MTTDIEHEDLYISSFFYEDDTKICSYTDRTFATHRSLESMISQRCMSRTLLKKSYSFFYGRLVLLGKFLKLLIKYIGINNFHGLSRKEC